MARRPSGRRSSANIIQSGFGLGAFVSLMSATFAYEDPLTRASTAMANAGTKAQTIYLFKDMGRNMWSSGKGFARVGALYSGVECCIESVSDEPFIQLPNQ
jgi:import inner membrane translocase subunit TIM22